MANAENIAGRLARIGLATTLLLAGNSAVVSANQPESTPRSSKAPITETTPIVPVNTALESQLTSLEDVARLEQFAKDNDFTELVSNRSETGLVGNGQIATWGLSTTYYHDNEVESLDGRVVRAADLIPNRNHPVSEEIEDLLGHDYSLALGRNLILPAIDTPKNQEQWGTVLIPKENGQDVNVFVRTRGYPTKYILSQVKEIWGVPFDGYYLYFETDGSVAHEAEAQGINSIDGTPMPSPGEDNLIYFGTASSDIIVLPKTPTDAQSQ